MPKRNDDLFQRLRRAGVRKPVAKALSELSEDAGKKAAAAGHRAVAELRALADEIEKRLPPTPPAPVATDPPVPVTPARRRATPSAARKTVTKTSPAKKSGTTARATKPSPSAPSARASAARRSAVASPSAPRGENKAKILSALKTGPHTASEIGQQTGIATATVSAALTRLAKSGEVTKATRGYALPG